MEKSNKSIFTALSTGLLSPVIQIQQNIELLKKHCNHSDQELLEETFSFTENSIENLLGFIKNFHFLNNTDQLKINMNPHWFSLQDLLMDIHEELKKMNHDPSRLNVIALPHSLKVYTDRYLINLILMNLVSNALKFSAKKVNLNISISKNKLSIVVCDFGIGIPQHQIDEIFDPFVKGENATKFPGTGIGLSIVKNAVECLEGIVSVQSILKEKTEFQVVLPYHQPLKSSAKTNRSNLNKSNITPLYYD